MNESNNQTIIKVTEKQWWTFARFPSAGIGAR